jgi:hypothetical protein
MKRKQVRETLLPIPGRIHKTTPPKGKAIPGVSIMANVEKLCFPGIFRTNRGEIVFVLWRFSADYVFFVDINKSSHIRR